MIVRSVDELRAQGDDHFRRREFQSAVSCYEAAIGLRPGLEIARYHYLVGRVEEERGDAEQAFLRYQAAIELEPDFVDPYVEMGGLLMKVEAPEGAAQAYADALRLEPAEPANHHNLVATLRILAAKEPQKYAEALASAEAGYRSIMEQPGASLPPDNFIWTAPKR